MDGWKARNKNFLAWIVAIDAFYIHYNTIDIKGLDTPAELNGRNKLRRRTSIKRKEDRERAIGFPSSFA